MQNYRPLILFCIIIAILGLAFLGSSLMVSASCNGIQSISPLNVYANVRRSPNTTSSIAYQLQNGDTREWDTLNSGWYHLVSGGYVYNSVVVEQCVPFPATPTKVVSVTKTVDANGNQEYHYICPSACEITVKLEGLP